MSSPDKLKRMKFQFALAAIAIGFGLATFLAWFAGQGPDRLKDEPAQIIGATVEPWTVDWEDDPDAAFWELAFSKGAAPPETWIMIARTDEPFISCEDFAGCGFNGFLHVRACAREVCSSSTSIRTPL